LRCTASSGGWSFPKPCNYHLTQKKAAGSFTSLPLDTIRDYLLRQQLAFTWQQWAFAWQQDGLVWAQTEDTPVSRKASSIKETTKFFITCFSFFGSKFLSAE
jgi:hypothetical protein